MQFTSGLALPILRSMQKTSPNTTITRSSTCDLPPFNASSLIATVIWLADYAVDLPWKNGVPASALACSSEPMLMAAE